MGLPPCPARHLTRPAKGTSCLFKAVGMQLVGRSSNHVFSVALSSVDGVCLSREGSCHQYEWRGLSQNVGRVAFPKLDGVEVGTQPGTPPRFVNR